MRAVALGAALFLQMLGVVDAGTRAEVKYLRYERAVTLPAGVSGEACAVLDAAVFAHMESRAGNDLRVFEDGGREVPFALTENEPQPEGAEVAMVEGMRQTGNRLEFDLRMPKQVYSEVDLRVKAKDFVAAAEVTDKETGTKLGTFSLFDFSGERFGRSTALKMAETTAPRLHVVMRFYDPQAKPFVGSVGIEGADVPTSREGQTVYTTVAETRDSFLEGGDFVMRLPLPAHVPVERVRIHAAPEPYTLRRVRVMERADGGGVAEEADGVITATTRAMPEALQMPVIHDDESTVDAVFAANLRRSAVVEVRIASNGVRVESVELQMRQRKVCFAAAAGKKYALRYGDAGVGAPVYEYARTFDGAKPVVSAELGAEQINAHFVMRSDGRTYRQRHPEWVWIAMLGVVAVLGATAVSSVKHQGRG